MRSGYRSRLFTTLQRAVAIGSVAMVFALGLFAASPILHEQLHKSTGVAVDHHCAVVLFANGVSLTLAVTAPPPPSADWRELPATATTEIFLDSPRYLLLPGRGPPLA